MPGATVASRHDAHAYQKARQRAKGRSAGITLGGQDIAPIPPVGNPGRRARADGDFKFFCETYFPHLFTLALDRRRALRVLDAPASAAEGRAACQGLAWSDDHLRVIAKIERVVRHRETLAVGMPRGSGKTTLCLVAVQWPILSGQGGFNSEMQRG